MCRHLQLVLHSSEDELDPDVKKVRTDDGRLCVVREEEVEVLENRPLLACAHRCNDDYINQRERLRFQ